MLADQRGFVQGAILLAGAAMISKLLGSVYTIILQNVIGDHGMGLFQMAYPIYATLLAIATAGFPVAISKLVSERVALGDFIGVRHIFRVAMALLTLAGIVCFCALFFGADIWARVAGDAEAAWAIRAIAPALLLVPIMSALRGYFQGYQWMEPTAVSQVIEQFVRVATILGLAIFLMRMGYGESYAAAGAAFGAVTGAGAGMLILAYFWKTRHPSILQSPDARQMTLFDLSKRLIYLAFPISLGALVVPLMNNVDVITVVNLLKATGESQPMATTHFGLLTGRAFKLMMLPTTLASGIGIAVMPAISEAFTLGFRRLMSSRIDMAIRLTVLLALPAAVGLVILAKPIDITLFTNESGSQLIQVMAVATIFASVQTTVAAVLQGAGWVYLPVLNLLLAGVAKLLGNLWLVPHFGVMGAAVATVGSYAIAMILNLYAMKRCLQEPLRWVNWALKPIVATFTMGAVVYAMYRQWTWWTGTEASRAEMGLACVIIVSVGMVVYGLSLIVSGALQENELASIPKIGPPIVRLCNRLGLLR